MCWGILSYFAIVSCGSSATRRARIHASCTKGFCFLSFTFFAKYPTMSQRSAQLMKQPSALRVAAASCTRLEGTVTFANAAAREIDLGRRML